MSAPARRTKAPRPGPAPAPGRSSSPSWAAGAAPAPGPTCRLLTGRPAASCPLTGPNGADTDSVSQNRPLDDKDASLTGTRLSPVSRPPRCSAAVRRFQVMPHAQPAKQRPSRPAFLVLCDWLTPLVVRRRHSRRICLVFVRDASSACVRSADRFGYAARLSDRSARPQIRSSPDCLPLSPLPWGIPP